MACMQDLCKLNHTVTLQDHKHFAFENRHGPLNILSVSIHKNVIDKNRTVSGHSSRGAGGWQRRADSRAGAMTTRSAGSLVRGEPEENRVNMIHTHQRRSNVPRSLRNLWKINGNDLKGGQIKTSSFLSKEVWRISTQKGYMLRIQSQTYT